METDLMLKSAKMLLVQKEDELAKLKEEISSLVKFIAEEEARLISAQSSLWTEPDAEGGMYLKPMQDIFTKLLDGNRAEKYWVKTHPGYEQKLLATLGSVASPNNAAYYQSAQNKYFGWLIIGGGFRLAEVIERDENGKATGFKEGYKIPWFGNHGPRGSTEILEKEWTADNKEEDCRRRAKRKMKNLDSSYKMYKGMGAGKAFLKKHPHYVPKDE